MVLTTIVLSVIAAVQATFLLVLLAYLAANRVRMSRLTRRENAVTASLTEPLHAFLLGTGSAVEVCAHLAVLGPDQALEQLTRLRPRCA